MIRSFIHPKPVRSMRPVAELSVAAPRAPQALNEVVFVVPLRGVLVQAELARQAPELGSPRQGR
jgi:hypothetical protein